MKKETPFLDFYFNSIKAGKMIDGGLCDSFGCIGLIFPEELIPDDYDYKLLRKNRKNLFAWASDSLDCEWYTFTPLRQNIVLLCAAINGEL